MVYRIVTADESQVGKYIDLTGDGAPDGIIFVDLAVGGHCQHNEISFDITSLPQENLSSYAVVGEYNDKEVLSPVLEGQDRFYVMALKDASILKYPWYSSCVYAVGYSMYNCTSTDLGSGKKNTTSMLEKKKDGEDFEAEEVSKDIKDIWDIIPKFVKDGWFIPSRDEWIAYFNAFPKASKRYWTSSQSSKKEIYSASAVQFSKDLVINLGEVFVFEDCSIRLARTI